MSVQSITVYHGGIQPMQAKDREAVRPAPLSGATKPGEHADQAIVSAQARDLSAALLGELQLPKLHLSPTELREMIMPPKRSVTVYDPRLQDPGTE